jgi:hypothetical protein
MTTRGAGAAPCMAIVLPPFARYFVVEIRLRLCNSRREILFKPSLVVDDGVRRRHGPWAWPAREALEWPRHQWRHLRPCSASLRIGSRFTAPRAPAVPIYIYGSRHFRGQAPYSTLAATSDNSGEPDLGAITRADIQLSAANTLEQSRNTARTPQRSGRRINRIGAVHRLPVLQCRFFVRDPGTSCACVPLQSRQGAP